MNKNMSKRLYQSILQQHISIYHCYTVFTNILMIILLRIEQKTKQSQELVIIQHIIQFFHFINKMVLFRSKVKVDYLLIHVHSTTTAPQEMVDLS